MEKLPMNTESMSLQTIYKSLSWDISQKSTENRFHAKRVETEFSELNI